MIPLFLSNTAPTPPDFMISGNWLVGALGFLIPLIIAAWFKGRQTGKTEAQENTVTLKEPVSEVPVKRIYTPPTFSQHQDLVRRVGALESDMREIRREAAEQFRKLLEVGEERKDKIMDRIEAVAVGFHQRVNQLVSEMHKPNPKK